MRHILAATRGRLLMVIFPSRLLEPVARNRLSGECNRTYAMRVLDMADLGGCRCVPKRDRVLCRVCDEFPMLREGNTRSVIAVGNWPFRDFRFGGCVDLLDFTAGCDKEVVVAPEEAIVVGRNESCVDLYEWTTIVAIPDSNRMFARCRDSITPWGVSRCVDAVYTVTIVECLHLVCPLQCPKWWHSATSRLRRV